MSAPVSQSASAFWIRPCGECEDSSPMMNDVTDSPFLEEYFDAIVNSANVCNHHGIEAKNLLVTEAFIDEDSMMFTAYDWLNPDDVNVKNFRTFERENATKEAFFLVQKFGVALEQMIEDADSTSGYHTYLPNVKHDMIQLLCDLHLLMKALRIEPHPDATREVMNKELRKLSKSGKLTRDFVVLRDYVKTTEHIRELFKGLKLQTNQ